MRLSHHELLSLLDQHGWQVEPGNIHGEFVAFSPHMTELETPHTIPDRWYPSRTYIHIRQLSWLTNGTRVFKRWWLHGVPWTGTRSVVISNTKAAKLIAEWGSGTVPPAPEIHTAYGVHYVIVAAVDVRVGDRVVTRLAADPAHELPERVAVTEITELSSDGDRITFGYDPALASSSISPTADMSAPSPDTPIAIVPRRTHLSAARIPIRCYRPVPAAETDRGRSCERAQSLAFCGRRLDDHTASQVAHSLTHTTCGDCYRAFRNTYPDRPY